MSNLRPLRFGKSEKDNPFKVKRVRRILKKLIPITLVIAILISMAIFLITLSGSSSVVNFILSGSSLKSTGNRVNVLLLGIAGGTHDGSNLTDTIMVASYHLKTNQLYFFSIPRDLWLPSLSSKANAAYEIGLSQGNGLNFAKTVMGNILGIPIHYALRMDFRGFVQAVDNLGGIDVLVDRSFDDYNFPIDGKEDDLCNFKEEEKEFSEDEAKKLNIEPGKKKVFIAPDGKVATDAANEDAGAKYFTCRYEHIGFEQGLIHMDGETALKFVRSRHGTNNEGSDFARSRRQQRVIEAIKSKVLSAQILIDPPKLAELIKTFGKSVDTDISVKAAVEFYNLSKKLNKVSNFALDDSFKKGLPGNRTSLLVRPQAADYGGSYVLISQDDDFSIIQGYVRKILIGEITEHEATAAARSR